MSRQIAPPWEPWPPPQADWPDYVKRIYLEGCNRIDELRKQIGPDGCIPIPFRCYLCDEMRSDYSMRTGDGVPICRRCVLPPDAEFTFEEAKS